MTTNPWTETPNLREYKLCLFGDGGVGKSALTVRFIQNLFVEGYDPTIEDWYRKQAVIDGEVALLEILDTAGQEEYKAMRDQYIRSSEGFLLVYSITSRRSFEQVIPLYEELLRVKDVLSCPAILVGNKCDLDYGREVSTREGLFCAEKMGCLFVETSAKMRINVDEAFHDLLREIRRRHEMGCRARQQSATTTKSQMSKGHGGQESQAHEDEYEHSGHCLSGCVIV